jgi:hypothetical protein
LIADGSLPHLLAVSDAGFRNVVDDPFPLAELPVSLIYEALGMIA